MAVEIKQSMKLAQQLVVTPQLQQAIKLLQMSRLELSTLIQQEMMENPILEETPEEEEKEGDGSHAEEVEKAKEDDRGHEHEVDQVGASDENLQKEPPNFDWESYIGTYNAPEVPITEKPPSDLPGYEATLTRPENLQEHLLWQVHLSSFDGGEVAIASEIIGNINDDGYLTATLDEIAEKAVHPVQKVEAVLKKIQELDPPGVAARDVRECLILQVKLLHEGNELLIKVIEDHLSDLESRNYAHLARKMKVSVDVARQIAKLIQELEPKPGRAYSEENPQYITPDVYVQKMGDDYVVTLNEDGLPKLQVSSFYRQTMLKKDDAGGQTREYINDKMRQAVWLIKSIHQRQRTLYKVASSIVKFQRDFLDKGIAGLRPMVLRDVAEDIGMHESTISRVTANKYVHTPRGIFELKYFFSSAVKKPEGDNVASESIRTAIRDMVSAESAKRPLPDSEISRKLEEQFGVRIARRTIAKYREALRIPPSSKRRRFE